MAGAEKLPAKLDTHQWVDVPKHRHKRGRRGAVGIAGIEKWVPTPEERELVFIAAANGVPQGTIAKMLHVNKSTVRSHFREELDDAFGQLKGRIVAALTVKALSGDLGAIKFWLAQYCPEWRMAAEATRVPLVDPAAGPATPPGQGLVRFYMPSNGRDGPPPDDEEEEGPTIEGRAEAA